MTGSEDETVISENTGTGEQEFVTATMLDGLEFIRVEREQYLSAFHAPPPTLFHYTSARALLRILESNQLWATNAVFMNDQVEIVHAAHILRNASDSLIEDDEFEGADPDQLLRATTAIRRVLNQLHNYVEAYVSCFCSDPDLLSQWRGYGEEGGVSVGFDSAKLRKFASDSPGIVALVEVTYESEKHYSQLYDLAKRWTKMYLKSLERDDRSRLHVEATLFAQSFAWLAASMKNSAFSEEKEWRLIYVRFRMPATLRTESYKIWFREDRGLVIPYVRFEPPTTGGETVRLPISAIKVGPNRYPTLVASGIGHLLSSLGLLESVMLDYSLTPLRT